MSPAPAGAAGATQHLPDLVHPRILRASLNAQTATAGRRWPAPIRPRRGAASRERAGRVPGARSRPHGRARGRAGRSCRAPRPRQARKRVGAIRIACVYVSRNVAGSRPPSRSWSAYLTKKRVGDVRAAGLERRLGLDQADGEVLVGPAQGEHQARVGAQVADLDGVGLAEHDHVLAVPPEPGRDEVREAVGSDRRQPDDRLGREHRLDARQRLVARGVVAGLAPRAPGRRPIGRRDGARRRRMRSMPGASRPCPPAPSRRGSSAAIDIRRCLAPAGGRPSAARAGTPRRSAPPRRRPRRPSDRRPRPPGGRPPRRARATSPSPAAGASGAGR